MKQGEAGGTEGASRTVAETREAVSAAVPNEKAGRLGAYAKGIGVAVALVTAIVGVLQFQKSIDQSKSELRWKKTALAREMVNKMLADEGWQAMTMLDWEEEGRKFEIQDKPRRTMTILPKDVPVALKASLADKRKKGLSEKEIFIADRFDRLFFLVSQIQSAVRSELVELRDVSFPLTWYIKNKLCRHRQLLEEYMENNSAPETRHFFESLPEWTRPECRERQS